MEITNFIKFNNKYPKLKGQRHARLIAAFNGMTSELLRNKFPDLMFYDTERDDGRYYNIEDGETYILLLFLGDKGNLFTSLRKQNDENVAKYNDSIGELFNIVIEA